MKPEKSETYLLEIVALAAFSLSSTSTTASVSVAEYASLGVWTQKVITFQPVAGVVIAGHSYTPGLFRWCVVW